MKLSLRLAFTEPKCGDIKKGMAQYNMYDCEDLLPTMEAVKQ